MDHVHPPFNTADSRDFLFLIMIDRSICSDWQLCDYIIDFLSGQDNTNTPPPGHDSIPLEKKRRGVYLKAG